MQTKEEEILQHDLSFPEDLKSKVRPCNMHCTFSFTACIVNALLPSHLSMQDTPPSIPSPSNASFPPKEAPMLHSNNQALCHCKKCVHSSLTGAADSWVGNCRSFIAVACAALSLGDRRCCISCNAESAVIQPARSRPQRAKGACEQRKQGINQLACDVVMLWQQSAGQRGIWQ